MNKRGLSPASSPGSSDRTKEGQKSPRVDIVDIVPNQFPLDKSSVSNVNAVDQHQTEGSLVENDEPRKSVDGNVSLINQDNDSLINQDNDSNRETIQGTVSLNSNLLFGVQLPTDFDPSTQNWSDLSENQLYQLVQSDSIPFVKSECPDNGIYIIIYTTKDKTPVKIPYFYDSISVLDDVIHDHIKSNRGDSRIGENIVQATKEYFNVRDKSKKNAADRVDEKIKGNNQLIRVTGPDEIIRSVTEDLLMGIEDYSSKLHSVESTKDDIIDALIIEYYNTWAKEKGIEETPFGDVTPFPDRVKSLLNPATPASFTFKQLSEGEGVEESEKSIQREFKQGLIDFLKSNDIKINDNIDPSTSERFTVQDLRDIIPVQERRENLLKVGAPQTYNSIIYSAFDHGAFNFGDRKGEGYIYTSTATAYDTGHTQKNDDGNFDDFVIVAITKYENKDPIFMVLQNEITDNELSVKTFFEKDGKLVLEPNFYPNVGMLHRMLNNKQLNELQVMLAKFIADRVLIIDLLFEYFEIYKNLAQTYAATHDDLSWLQNSELTVLQPNRDSSNCKEIIILPIILTRPWEYHDGKAYRILLTYPAKSKNLSQEDAHKLLAHKQKIQQEKEAEKKRIEEENKEREIETIDQTNIELNRLQSNLNRNLGKYLDKILLIQSYLNRPDSDVKEHLDSVVKPHLEQLLNYIETKITEKQIIIDGSDNHFHSDKREYATMFLEELSGIESVLNRLSESNYCGNNIQGKSWDHGGLYSDLCSRVKTLLGNVEAVKEGIARWGNIFQQKRSTGGTRKNKKKKTKHFKKTIKKCKKTNKNCKKTNKKYFKKKYFKKTYKKYV
jgi:hypothetical protein